MIHKQMDDDKDGGIEVDESDEVGVKSLHFCIYDVFAARVVFLLVLSGSCQVQT